MLIIPRDLLPLLHGGVEGAVEDRLAGSGGGGPSLLPPFQGGVAVRDLPVVGQVQLLLLLLLLLLLQLPQPLLLHPVEGEVCAPSHVEHPLKAKRFSNRVFDIFLKIWDPTCSRPA